MAEKGVKWESGRGRYTFANTNTSVLWRFSVNNPAWTAGALQGVDFSTMVFGLAAHPSMLGKEWFEKYNNFDFPGIAPGDGLSVHEIDGRRVFGQSLDNPSGTASR